MGSVERLDAMRAGAEGCRLVAFGDLRTRLVLRMSADRSWPQERLDELCSQAAECFDRADSEVFAAEFSEAHLDEAIMLAADGIRLFIRPENGESDVICCVCNDAAALAPLASAARAVLSEM